jgi:hypothetical protein
MSKAGRAWSCSEEEGNLREGESRVHEYDATLATAKSLGPGTH